MKVWLLVAGFLAVAHPVRAVDCSVSVTAPVRPSFQDISIKHEARGDLPYQFDHDGCMATQVWEDAAQETRAGIAVPEALRYLRTLTESDHTMYRDVSLLSNIEDRFGIVYEIARALKDTLGGSWQTDADGKHYAKEAEALQDIQARSLVYPVECAASPLMTTDLLDVLDLRIEGDRCVRGASFTFPSHEPRDAYREVVGMVQAKTLMPPLTDTQLTLIDIVHAAHHAVTASRCGTGPAQREGLVDDLHRALEATARTEAEHHFLRMKDFARKGHVAVDPLWTPAEVCYWSRLADAFHHQWKDAVVAGRWGLSRMLENDHQMAHICMGLKAGLYVKFSCGLGVDGGEVRECPILTCEEYLAAHGEERLAASRDGANPLSMTIPATVVRNTKFTGSVSSTDAALHRVTLWLFPPSVHPAEGETWLNRKADRIWSLSLHPLGAFSKRIARRWPPGVYTLVAHVPNEPGSVDGDLLAEATFEVVT